MTKDRNDRIPVRSVEEIPDFASEAEEAAFWRTHRWDEALLDAAAPLPPDAFPPGFDAWAEGKRTQRKAARKAAGPS